MHHGAPLASAPQMQRRLELKSGLGLLSRGVAAAGEHFAISLVRLSATAHDVASHSKGCGCGCGCGHHNPQHAAGCASKPVCHGATLRPAWGARHRRVAGKRQGLAPRLLLLAGAQPTGRCMCLMLSLIKKSTGFHGLEQDSLTAARSVTKRGRRFIKFKGKFLRPSPFLFTLSQLTTAYCIACALCLM